MQTAWKKIRKLFTHTRKPEVRIILPATRDNMLRRYVLMCLAIGVPALAYGQAVAVTPDVFTVTGSRLFAALIGGVVLALAFQLLLTNLSVAVGLNVAGPIGGKAEGRQQRQSSQEQESGGVQSAIRKVSSAFGIWTLITASISVFFASLLAARLSLAITPATGAILGLTIWGLFYLVTMTIEASAVSSLVGSMIEIARSSFRAVANATRMAFEKSPEDRVAEAASRVTASVRQELFGDTEDFQDQVRSFIRQLKPAMPSPEQIGSEIAKSLSETEIKMYTSPDWHQTTVDFIEHATSGMTREQAQGVVKGIQGAAKIAKEEAGTKKDVTSKVAEGAMRMAGVSSQEAQSIRHKVENYLRSTGKQSLNPEGIKHDIEQLISSPKAGAESLKQRIQGIDKSSVATLLAQRKDMSKEEAQKVVDQVDRVLSEISGKTQAAQGQAQGQAQAVQGKAQGLPSAVAGRIQGYLDSLNRPELRYEGIEHDIRLLFRNPSAGLDALEARAKSMDRDTIKALLASRKDISDADAEHIVSRFESTRDEYLQKYDKAKAEVARRMEAARNETLHQIDETRKTAATASWWVFATALVSGFFAYLGGRLGV